ncbi:MAG: ribonuclease Z [Bacteroidaceae bacterium]|nr:ribonuclease Z [Bacteroidaceae bacterium]
MEKFEIHILGCGSALPTTRHNPSAQVVNIREKLYMIDCGEGTQMQLRHAKLKFSRLNHIFISHLHGDHCFGLIGLISTFDLLGRTATLHIHAPQQLEQLMTPWLNFFCQHIGYEVKFHPFDTRKSCIIHEDRSMSVTTLPLKHRVPCAGFIFDEKPTPDHLIREMIDRHQIPTYELNRIKNGGDYQTPEGETIPHDRLTTPARPPRRYVYCSDTTFLPENQPLIKNADLLFHEATFASDNEARCNETYHSTARQAATMAKESHAKQLIIGHFSARYEDETPLLNEAKEVFTNTLLAHELMKISL